MRLEDLATGERLLDFPELQGQTWPVVFSPDGRRLISGHTDSTLLVWPVAADTPRTDKLTADDVAKALGDLTDSDASRAFRARFTLVSMPDLALVHLKKFLRPAQPLDPKRLQKPIDDLGSQQYPVRIAATMVLEELGERAADALRQAIKKSRTLEHGRRAEALLSKLRGPVTRTETLLAVRAVAVLEDIGNPEARKLLEELAQGTTEARLTREARAALQRPGKP